MDKEDRFVWTAFAAMLVIALSLLGVGGYVAWHFLQKVW